MRNYDDEFCDSHEDETEFDRLEAEIDAAEAAADRACDDR